jgi:hypothetical protein
MSCALTQGFTLDCKDSLGGIKSVRFATLADWEAQTPVYGASGIVTVTPLGNAFWKYEQLKETSSLTENINSAPSAGTVYYTPEVVVVLSKLEAAKRNEIKLLAQNRLVAIVETNDETPTYWVVGCTTGLEVSAGSSASGTAYADLQGYSITFSGMEAAPMFNISASDAAGMTN